MRYEDGCGFTIFMVVVALLLFWLIGAPENKETQYREYKAWVKYTGRDDITYEEYELIKERIR